MREQERESAAGAAWDFIKDKLSALKTEKGLAGVWSNGFSSGYHAAGRASQAEIERLRTALQTIASRADGYSHGDDHVTAAFAGIANVALAALSGSKE